MHNLATLRPMVNPKPSADILPRGVRVAICVLILATLAGVSIVRLTGVDIREPDAPAVASRMLRFVDGAEGSVVVIDASTKTEVARIVGEQGFLRGALRALARGRRFEGVGSGPAFELISRSDGRLTLVDPVTQQRIDLESFGPTNVATFARLLQNTPGASSAPPTSGAAPTPPPSSPR